MRNDFFMDNTSFLQPKMKFDRETFGGLADMFGQMPGVFWHTFKFQQIDMCPHTFMSCVLLGYGIGTGPGVIQDHYSPTMGRHRATPHYSDHAVNGSSLHQTQFDSGNKPFIKQNQVKENIYSVIFPALLIWKDVFCFFLFFFSLYIPNKSYSQGQNSPVFNHKQNHLVQMQSKDMAPRFGKKGKLNADEVKSLQYWLKNWCVFEFNLLLNGLKQK